MIWRIQQLLHIALWTAVIYRGMSLQILEAWQPAFLFTCFQGMQYPLFSRRIGERADYSRGQALVLTLLLGYAWWYPLKKRSAKLHP
jgi:hypothetical protein